MVADLTNKRYAFESTTRPNIVWVDFEKIDFSEGSGTLKLDLVGKLALEGGLAGDVSDRFEDIGELGLDAIRTSLHALEFIARRQDEFTNVATFVKGLGLGAERVSA